MTYPGKFLRLQASGKLYSVESWSWSLSLIPTGGGAAAPATVPAAVKDAVKVFHNTAGMIGQYAGLETLKLNEIGPDGRYVDQGNTVFTEYNPIEWGEGGSPAPQLALAISLRTARRRGRASAGRFYVPACAFAPFSDGRLTVAHATEAATAATTMLNAINAAVPGYTVGVASNLGTGDFEPVTHVAVGRVLDTIRSRRTSLPEDHIIGASLSGFGGGGGGF